VITCMFLHALHINCTLLLFDQIHVSKQQFLYYLFITLFYFPAPFSYQIAFQSFGKCFSCGAMDRKPILDRLFDLDFQQARERDNLT